MFFVLRFLYSRQTFVGQGSDQLSRQHPQRREVVGTVVPEAVDEEGGRFSHPAFEATFEILSHPVGMLRQLPVEPLRMEAQPLCVAPEILLQMSLIVKEEIVHLPLAALRGSLGVRVYAGKREVPEDE